MINTEKERARQSLDGNKGAKYVARMRIEDCTSLVSVMILFM